MNSTLGLSTLRRVNLFLSTPGSRSLCCRKQRQPAIESPRLISSTAEQWSLTSSVTTEDETVQDIFEKARIGLQGMVAENGAMDAGIFEYGGQWFETPQIRWWGLFMPGILSLQMLL